MCADQNSAKPATLTTSPRAAVRPPTRPSSRAPPRGHRPAPARRRPRHGGDRGRGAGRHPQLLGRPEDERELDRDDQHQRGPPVPVAARQPRLAAGRGGGWPPGGGAFSRAARQKATAMPSSAAEPTASADRQPRPAPGRHRPGTVRAPAEAGQRVRLASTRRHGSHACQRGRPRHDQEHGTRDTHHQRAADRDHGSRPAPAARFRSPCRRRQPRPPAHGRAPGQPVAASPPSTMPAAKPVACSPATRD